MTQVWTGFQTMTSDECRRLLASTDVGRVAITAGALPFVLPVQYRPEGDRLLMRTPGHHEVSGSIDGQVVGFETDDIDLVHGVGWCVSVTGAVQVVRREAMGAPARRWFCDGVVLSLDTDVIVGHRMTA